VAKSYALAGDKTKAQTAFQDFLALWSDADADAIPLRQAKIEYSKWQLEADSAIASAICKQGRLPPGFTAPPALNSYRQQPYARKP